MGIFLVYLLMYGGGLVTALVILLVYFEQLERVFALIYGGLSSVSIFFRKKAVTTGIQASVNIRTKSIGKAIGNHNLPRLKLEFVKANEFAELRDGEVIIRLKNDPSHNANVLNAARLFVSLAVLSKTKRYLSKSQRNAIDLYVLKDIVQGCGAGVETRFHDEVWRPTLQRDETARFYGLVERADSVHLLYPIVVRELELLGGKVFYRRPTHDIVRDATQLLTFVSEYANRRIGEDMELTCKGSFIRCGIMIIARWQRREKGDIDPYVRYIQSLVDEGLEGIYLIGSAADENRRFMDDVVKRACTDLGLMRAFTRRFRTQIQDSEGPRQVRSYFVALKNPHIARFFDQQGVDELRNRPFESGPLSEKLQYTRLEAHVD